MVELFKEALKAEKEKESTFDKIAGGKSESSKLSRKPINSPPEEVDKLILHKLADAYRWLKKNIITKINRLTDVKIG